MFSAGIGLRARGNAPGGSLSDSDEEEHIWKDPGIDVDSCWDSIMDLRGHIFHQTTLKTISQRSMIEVINSREGSAQRW